MTWIYRPNLASSAAREEDSSPASISSGGEPFVMLSTQHILPKSSRPESVTAILTTPPSGMTLEHSTGGPGVDQWILSLLDSRANHSLPLENVRQTMITETDGQTPFALSAKSDQGSHFWKTSKVYLVPPAATDFGTSEPYSETWPKAGMMQDGNCYQQPKLERPIGEIVSGLWRTPNSTVIEPKSSVTKLTGRTPADPQVGLADQVVGRHKWATPSSADSIGTHGGGQGRSLRTDTWKLNKEKHSMPTPTAAPEAPNKNANTKGPKNLLEVAESGWSPGMTWPTPRAAESTESWETQEARRARGSFAQPNLTSEVKRRKKLWGTPRTQMHRDGTGREHRNRSNLEEEAGGSLNPVWVAWLMGWPMGWTDLEPLGEGDMEEWLYLLSRGEWWSQDPADQVLLGVPYISRLTKSKKNRTARLKAIGNGQVSLCMAVAWRILTED